MKISQGITEMQELEKEHKQAQAKIGHLNCVLRAIRNVYQLIIEDKERDRLLKNICDKLIETRGYYNAWIAILDKSGGLITTAEAGLGNNFSLMLEQLKCGELPDCARRALSQSKIVLTNDPLSDCMDCPLSNMYGGRGAMTVQLGSGEKAYGLLSVSIHRNFLSDTEEKILFNELSRDIGIALHNLALEEEKERAACMSRMLEYKYRTLFENSKDPVYITSKEGDFLDINQSFLDLFNYAREELINIKVWKLYVNPKDRIKFQKEIERKGFLKDFEMKLKKKNGAVIDCLLTSNLHRAEDGNIVGYQGIIRDITEKKHVEKEIAESEERYRTFFETSSDCIFISTKDGQWLDANQAVVELFGHKNKDGLLKSSVFEIYENPKDRGKITQSMEQGSAKGFEINFRKVDGTIINVLVTGIARRDKNGNVLGYQGTFKDITESKKIQAALQESEKFNSSLLDNSPHPILVINPDTSIRYMNHALEMLTGFSSEELVGRKAPYPWFIHETQNETLVDLNNAMRKGLRGLEKVFQRKDGKQFTVEITSASIRKNRELKYYIANWVDITERKQVETALVQRERELQIKTINLEETNTALKVLLKKREEDKIELEKKVLFNVRELVTPYIEKLKRSMLDESQEAYVEVLESNLNDIISPFSARLSSSYLKFTSTELKVSNLIKHGKTTKEIAMLLNLSDHTVAAHRKSIRSKIGIKNQKKANLRNHLLSLQ